MIEKKHVIVPGAMDHIFRKQIFVPIAALLLLVVSNLVPDPSLFKIILGRNSGEDPVPIGYLITILDYGSEVAILSISVALATAVSSRQDISVGAATAIADSVILRVLVGCGGDGAFRVPIPLAFLTACVVAMLFGASNSVLVSTPNTQLMVAILILYTVGRFIAAWINNNESLIIADRSFTYFGGFIPGTPISTPFSLAVVCIIITTLVLKSTSLGPYTQAVGANSDSSRLNGLNSISTKWLNFVILNLRVVVVVLIKTSRLSTISYLVIAKGIEMDAILAMALGGNVLNGGKFSIVASILETYVIQLLTTTFCKLNVSSDALPAYKAMVAILLVVASTPVVKVKLSALGKNLKKQKEVG